MTITKLRYTYKTQPFSHQKKALTKILQLKGKCALLMEMGTGKTKVAIDWASIGYHNFGTKKVLVVAPLSVLGVWPRQVRQHGGAPSRIFRLGGATRNRVRVLKLLLRDTEDERLTYVVINYEGIWREDDAGNSIRDLLCRWKPDLVVFDEAHRLKSPTSKQSKAAAKIGEVAGSVLLLTGTHITKSPLDVFGQFRAMNKKVFGDNWYAFKFTYGIWGGFGKYQLRGYRNLKSLVLRVRQHSFRITKDQCLDLPPKLFETVPVTLSSKAMNIYTQMAKEMIVELEETQATAAIVLVKLLRLSQITSGFIKDVDGNIQVFDDSKLNTCLDLLEDLLEEDHKVVIFCRFIQDIELLRDQMIKKKIGYVILSGNVPGPQRDSLIDKFQTNPETKVFIAQIHTGSEGIELTAADAVIYYSMDYSALHYWQSQDRVHRPGQTKKVTYYHLVVPRTIDQVVLSVLKEKKNVADTILKAPLSLIGGKN